MATLRVSTRRASSVRRSLFRDNCQCWHWVDGIQSFPEGAVGLPPDLIWLVFSEKTIRRHFCLYSDFRKLFFPQAIRESMKPSHIFILVLNLLITLALACVVVLLYSNGQEKDRVIQELKAQQQVDGQKALKAQ